jgi:predicted membrane protein
MLKLSFAAGLVALILNYTDHAFVPMWIILVLIFVPVALSIIPPVLGILGIAVGFVISNPPKFVQNIQHKRRMEKLRQHNEADRKRKRDLYDRRVAESRNRFADANS